MEAVQKRSESLWCAEPQNGTFDIFTFIKVLKKIKRCRRYCRSWRISLYHGVPDMSISGRTFQTLSEKLNRAFFKNINSTKSSDFSDKVVVILGLYNFWWCRKCQECHFWALCTKAILNFLYSLHSSFGSNSVVYISRVLEINDHFHERLLLTKLHTQARRIKSFSSDD